mgnify:FL=1
MREVLTNLEALAAGMGKQDVDTMLSFYSIANARLLKTEEQRQAFRYGALAMFADAAGYKIRAAYYRRKFKKAIKALN